MFVDVKGKWNIKINTSEQILTIYFTSANKLKYDRRRS